MDCENAREALPDLVRGRLDPVREAELRHHLAGCEPCRHEESAERLLEEALTERLPRPAAPAALRRRIVERLGALPAPAGAGRVRSRTLGRLALAATAVLVAGALGVVAGRAGSERALAADRLADELVADHLRSLASGHPYDVESSDAHQVKPWFEGRLDFAPVVPGDRGELRLAGGAVGFVLDRKAAVVSYGLRRHRLTLLAFPRAGLPGFDALPGQAPHRLSRRGFEAAIWAAGDVGYALVADVGGDELSAIAAGLAGETRR